ncbi:MAG: hypothetical protein RIQ62_1959 [Bacteroidota bacterium]
MCGIVGCVGKENAIEVVLSGLEALEYRGYDSAGVAVIEPNEAICTKQIGAVDNLEKLLAKRKPGKNTTAIGHTRWATHGEPSIQNAHPHFNTDKTIFVVHNGIIENYQQIREHLQKKNYVFVTETDTEVIPHLIDWHMRKAKSFDIAFERAIKELHGAYAIAAVYSNEPGVLYAARLSSPLIIGVGENEYYVASDATAILDKTKKVVYLNDYDIARITPQELHIRSTKGSKEIIRDEHLLDYDGETAKLGHFPHFMLKEIFDTPQTILSATSGRAKPKTNSVHLGGLLNVQQQLQFVDRIVIVACGTSYYAGMIGEYLIEELSGIPVEVQLASEFKYRHEPFSRGTAVLAISQSGETADTIAALKKVESYGVLRLGIVNVVGSTIARMTDAGVYCHAGPELSVASTKAFIAQVTVLIEIALYLSKDRFNNFKPLLNELAGLDKKIESILAQAKTIKKISQKYAHYKDFLYIGRGYDFPCALEGALKLKELSYIHAEGCAAGEMKHGPLAMIDKNFPTVAIVTDSELSEKTYSNMEEIKARKGPIIAIATEGDSQVNKLADDCLFIPKSLPQTQPILIAVVLHLLAYYVATEKGLNVDRPRNLAKSVTVE